MARKPKETKPHKAKHTSLILVEGATEVEFYKTLAAKHLNTKSKVIKDMNGNFNILTKVLDKAKQYSDAHPQDTFDIYVCIDQDRIGTPAINEKLLQEELEKINGFKSLTCVIAVLVIESLFFIDIDGIYAHLKAPKNKRNPKNFSNFRALTDQDLSRLFKSFKKLYQKGHRCNGLVSKLDTDKIINTANELNHFVKSFNSK